MMNVVAQMSGVHFSYRTSFETIHALRDVDFAVAAGELVCLLGASGSGKSTLLNLLAGLELPELGTVSINGRLLNETSDGERTAIRLMQIGMVFQNNNLITQFSVQENVELVLRCQGHLEPHTEALRLLELVGVAELAKRRPSDMSGGQQQRVGIARALAGKRKLLLCDEPTGNLDSTNSRKLFTLLHDLAHSKQVAVVVATHDGEALEFSDRVVRMCDGQVVTDGV